MRLAELQIFILPDQNTRLSKRQTHTGDAEAFAEAVRRERDSLPENIDEVCKAGASKFLLENIGKGGKFYDIKKKAISDWEQEEIDREEEATAKHS